MDGHHNTYFITLTMLLKNIFIHLLHTTMVISFYIQNTYPTITFFHQTALPDSVTRNTNNTEQADSPKSANMEIQPPPTSKLLVRGGKKERN
jgi:hypothetical protein